MENIVRKGEIACNKQFLHFSSPEHEVLKVRYCDRPVVRLSIRLWVRLSVQSYKKIFFS